MQPVVGETYTITDTKEGKFIGRVLADPEGRHILIGIVDPLESGVQLPAGESTDMIETRLTFEALPEDSPYLSFVFRKDSDPVKD